MEQPTQEHSIRTLTTLAVGSGLLLLPLLPIGMFQGINTPDFRYLFYAHLGVLALTLLVAFSQIRSAVVSATWPAAPLWVVLFVWIAAIALLGLLPVIARDALIHHLAVPKWWIQNDHIHEIHWHSWSYYPMLVNLGFTGLMLLKLGSLASLYHLSYLIILAALVGAFLLRYFKEQPNAAVLGVLLTLTTPICIRLGSEPLVDLGLALFIAATVVCLVEWVESGGRGAYQIIIAGAAFGLALGCKYNGLLAASLLFPIFLAYCSRRQILGRGVFALILCGLICFLTYLPWMIKNTLWVENPFYPILKGIFPGSAPVVQNPIQGSSLSPLQYRMMSYGEDWKDLLLLPFRIFLFGRDDDPKYFDGVLGPIFLLGIFVLPLVRKKSWIMFFCLFVLGYLAFALVLGSARVRYLIPIIAPLGILAVVGLTRLTELFPKRVATVFIPAVLVLQLIFSGQYLLSVVSKRDLFKFYSESQTHAEYLRRQLGDFPMIEYINRALPSSATVYLALTANRFYYYNRNVISGGHDSSRTLRYWLQISRDAQAVYREFQARGVTHILVHTERLKRSFAASLDGNTLTNWNDFQKQYLQPVQHDNAYSLWEVAPAPPPEVVTEESDESTLPEAEAPLDESAPTDVEA